MRIGIDLGGTNIAVGLVDNSGQILAAGRRKTLPERGLGAIAADMADLCREMAMEGGLPLADIASVGIGSPGSIDTNKGVVIFSGNLQFRDAPLAAALEEKIMRPVKLGNDANVAALGEVVAGAGRGADSLVMITLGTGVGGGFVFDRRIYAGFNGSAGEVGHMVTHAHGLPCTCGRKGCWEAYASATALVRLTKKAMDEAPDSLMFPIAEELGAVNGRVAFKAARQNDPAGEAVVAEYLEEISIGAANLINLLQPDILCIGGGISGEGEYLTDRLRPLIEANCFKAGDKRSQIILAKLGNSAGIIGAAMLG